MWPARTWLLEGVYVVLGWRGLCQSYQKCPISLVSLFLLSLPVLLSAAIDHSKKGTRALHWVFSIKITAFQSWWNLINKVLHLWFVLCALKKSLSNPRSQIVSLCFLLRFHLEIYLWCVQLCHLLAPVSVSFSVAVIKSPDRSNREGLWCFTIQWQESQGTVGLKELTKSHPQSGNRGVNVWCCSIPFLHFKNYILRICLCMGACEDAWMHVCAAL